MFNIKEDVNSIDMNRHKSSKLGADPIKFSSPVSFSEKITIFPISYAVFFNFFQRDSSRMLIAQNVVCDLFVTELLSLVVTFSLPHVSLSLPYDRL